MPIANSTSAKGRSSGTPGNVTSATMIPTGGMNQLGTICAMFGSLKR